jgi:hypothetical protein
MAFDRAAAERTRANAAAATCPLCGGPNACALAAGMSTPCWCVGAVFPAALREGAARVAGPARCICTVCASTAACGQCGDDEAAPALSR